MHNYINSLAFVSGNRGPGFLIIFGAIVFIVFFDKIVKLVIYVVDRIEERKRGKKL
jgi:hypothetical protein